MEKERQTNGEEAHNAKENETKEEMAGNFTTKKPPEMEKEIRKAETTENARKQKEAEREKEMPTIGKEAQNAKE